MRRIVVALVAVCSVVGVCRAQSAVTVTQDDQLFTLDNGIVTARVAKVSGDLVSVRFKDTEMLATILTPDGQPDLKQDPPGATVTGLNRNMTDHQYAFWSHDAMGPRGTAPAIATITIDPATNSGERAEVSVKGIAKGRLMGTGPGAKPTGNFASDIEIRYCLGRGDSGIYTYCIFEHPAGYPTSGIGEARFCAKLNSFFDWLSAGDKYNKPYPKEQEKGEDKYVYTNVQSENPAFGWSSTTKPFGFYIINPSQEYMSGGPTKREFLGHRDTNRVAAPCVLNYWRSSHYGGAAVDVAEDEHWTKIVGPFFLYVTSGADPQAMYADAKAEAQKQIAQWLFDWVRGVDYPAKADRSTVSGQLILTDPQAASTALPHLQVGLTHAAYASPVVGPNGARQIDWQIDAKFYEFWTRGAEDGTFSIPNVRAGIYTLHAFADGVLGEYAQANVTVESGKPLDLGKITWTPVRRGRQIWEIGIPNRNGSEFFKAEDYAVLDVSLQYPKLFPNDINFVIGKSDYRTDWFFQHVPHNVDPNARAAPFFGIRGADGLAAPRSVTFDMPSAPSGTATLRLALCGGSAHQIDVTVNGKLAGTVDHLIGDGTLTRHQIQGIWYEKELPFDAALLKQGTNVLTLTIPAGPINNGVIYDYLRLELAEPVPATQAAAVLNPNLPTLFIAGDSTAQPGNPNAVGWGKPFVKFFDPGKINIVNGARGGRSSRTFITDGSWDHILSRVKAHDYVLIQFGQNDGAKVNDVRAARGSLPALGEETQEIDNLQTHQHEVVHTFGFYMRQMIHDTQAKGATPILMSLTVRDIWHDGHVERGSGHYDEWAKTLAQTEGVAFLDLTNLVADRYEQMGQDTVKGLFPKDSTHTGANGAEINAEYVVAGLKALHENGILRNLSAAGRAIDIAAPTSVLAPKLPVPRGAPRDVFLRWLNLPEPADAALPDVFLIGDSTVRNGRGDGVDGQWGWGDALSVYFDPGKVNLVNRAVGGTGARTFITSGYWDSVLAMLKPGDIVVMQFGTNDNGARGALPGVGEETKTVNEETVHMFGWYLRKYVADAKAKGATPIICTLVPRNSWKDGKVARNPGTHADWARTVAKEAGVPLLDLYESIAQKYDALGQKKTLQLFADGRVHTGHAGAELSAGCVLAQMRAIPGDPMAKLLRDKPAENW